MLFSEAEPFMHYRELLFGFVVNMESVSKRLDLDQARRFVGPDLGPTCVHKLSADDTSRYKELRTSLLCVSTFSIRQRFLTGPLKW